jgi:transposase-like protein
MNFNNLLDLATKISTESIAIAYFIKMRWNENIVCPFKDCVANEFKDTKKKIYVYKNGKDFKCSCCKKRFSYKTGTVIENSKISMRKWLMAIYIFVAHKKGISSVQLGKDIGVRQGTAWFMLHRLREVMDDEIDNQFNGVSEVDETYIDGKEKRKIDCCCNSKS